MIREVIEHATAVAAPALPEEPVQAGYGRVELHTEALLLHNLNQLSVAGGAIDSVHPLPMEHYGLGFGMLAYTYAFDASTHSSMQ